MSELRVVIPRLLAIAGVIIQNLFQNQTDVSDKMRLSDERVEQTR
jgi:hypothetical protein